MKTVEKVCLDKDTFLSLNTEITASTIIALEKVCFSCESKKNNEKEND